MTYRELAVRQAEDYARRHVHETSSNWGPMVSKFLQSTGINFPAAWCMALWHYIYKQLGIDLGGGASVGNFRDWARKAGDVVHRPFRGDLGCWDFSGDGWPDHVFGVARVLRLGPLWVISTVEGNTSSGQAGSQDDGGGVYIRRRVVRNSTVNGAVFVRIPGQLPNTKRRVKPGPPRWRQIR